MDTAARGTVRVMRKYAAEPDRVFDAWLDPGKAGRFLFATPTGTMVKTEIAPRVCGRFMFADRRRNERTARRRISGNRPRAAPWSLVSWFGSIPWKNDHPC